jgi:hypothetical protein
VASGRHDLLAGVRHKSDSHSLALDLGLGNELDFLDGVIQIIQRAWVASAGALAQDLGEAKWSGNFLLHSPTEVNAICGDVLRCKLGRSFH